MSPTTYSKNPKHSPTNAPYSQPPANGTIHRVLRCSPLVDLLFHSIEHGLKFCYYRIRDKGKQLYRFSLPLVERWLLLSSLGCALWRKGSGLGRRAGMAGLDRNILETKSPTLALGYRVMGVNLNAF
jgi:hypothetical protein